ncbi:hypothetical protein DMB44_07245 [Thermoplasma sp. Kam2015]|uniref:hypothetical protein n=1 Tax=Thermoplasma sp. Kam2015 TaxID=2094122 RepID=UPI000D83BB1A|nr:hypothetical protein [Thermoplasma sp. Kam2015]PYB67824.1 hypothetical protein DMB44_07245 [Thermoplasma sp. Kam2015]
MNASVKAVYSIGGLQLIIAVVLWIIALSNSTGDQRVWAVVFAVDLILSGVIAFIIMRHEMEVG